jgi:predicted DNA-binding transcriptional regulator AlpA
MSITGELVSDHEIAEMQDQLLTTEQLATVFQINKMTAHRWRYRGKGPAFLSCGKVVRYRRSDVEQWINEEAAKNAKRGFTSADPQQ